MDLTKLADDEAGPLADRHSSLSATIVSDAETCHWSGGRSLKPDARTLFEIGSITKVFTSLALAIAVEKGEVTLDDPLHRHLPEGVRVPSRDGADITLGHLASHASGLPRLPRGMSGDALRFMVTRGDPYAKLTTDRVLSGLGDTRLRRTPGQRSRYSNLGAGLLGHALASAAGMPYETVIRERICDPLGLTDTAVGLDGDQRTRLAQGHSKRGKRVSGWDLTALAGAGALHSTGTDLAVFLRAQLGLTETPLAAAIKSTHERRGTMGGAGICLGWLRIPAKDHSGVLFHNGGTGGYRSVIALVPERRIGVAVLSSTARSVDRIGLNILRALARNAP